MTFVWLGTLLGAVIGLLHGGVVFRRQLVAPGGGTLGACWFTLWTVALWTVFGAYVLAFWILGAVGLALAGLFRPGRRGA